MTTGTTPLPGGFQIDLIADGVKVRDTTARRAFTASEKEGQVKRITWEDFLHNATTALAEFLDAHDRAQAETSAQDGK